MRPKKKSHIDQEIYICDNETNIKLHHYSIFVKHGNVKKILNIEIEKGVLIISGGLGESINKKTSS